MAVIRITVDLAIPEAVYAAIPAAKKLAAQEAIRALRTLAVRVGDETTVKATMHRCLHDETPLGLCSPEQEI